VLAAADGGSNVELADRLELDRGTVSQVAQQVLWKLAAMGCWMSRDRVGHGIVDDAQIEKLITLPRRWRPRPEMPRTGRRGPDGRAPRLESVDGLAGLAGRSDWHRTNRIPGNCPKDPLFVARSVTSSGLYLNPPERALVLCVDEKTQIQALKPDPTGVSRCCPARRREPAMDYVPTRHLEPVRRVGSHHRKGDRRAAFASPGH